MVEKKSLDGKELLGRTIYCVMMVDRKEGNVVVTAKYGDERPVEKRIPLEFVPGDCRERFSMFYGESYKRLKVDGSGVGYQLVEELRSGNKSQMKGLIRLLSGE